MDQARRRYVADAVLGIDTLWGGDVMCASGTGRFIADSWFSDEPLPAAYTHPAAARLREIRRRVGQEGRSRGGRSSTCARWIFRRPLPESAKRQASSLGGLREPYLTGLAVCLETMWDLAMEILGKGDPVPYARCVEASTGSRPSLPSRRQSASALPNCWAAPDTPSDAGGLLDAVDAWRRERVIPMASVRALGAAVIAHFDNLSAKNLLPYLPEELAPVPRANIEFLPIKDAWFSGSMNYIGRARNADGSPQVRSDLRDQCFAADLVSGVRTTGEPRSCARTRHHLCLSAESVRARKGRLRSYGAHHEHARRHAV